MPRGAANLDLQNQLNTLSEIGVVGNLSDGSLLEQIVRGPDGVARAAFTVLVERHGPMVLGVCSQALANPHDVDDAFQATFLVLAQKAASVRKADSVASWLHGVVLRVAARARNEVVRRSKFERRSAEMKSKQLECGESRPDVWPELHEEIASLPKHFREPVVLCYLEGLSAELACAAARLSAGNHSFAVVASSRTVATPADPPRFCVSRSIRVVRMSPAAPATSDSLARHNRPRITEYCGTIVNRDDTGLNDARSPRKGSHLRHDDHEIENIHGGCTWRLSRCHWGRNDPCAARPSARRAAENLAKKRGFGIKYP